MKMVRAADPGAEGRCSRHALSAGTRRTKQPPVNLVALSSCRPPMGMKGTARWLPKSLTPFSRTAQRSRHLNEGRSGEDRCLVPVASTVAELLPFAQSAPAAAWAPAAIRASVTFPL